MGLGKGTEKVFGWWRENGVLEKCGGYQGAEQEKTQVMTGIEFQFLLVVGFDFINTSRLTTKDPCTNL